MCSDTIEKLRERLNGMMQMENPDLNELLKMSVELDKHIVQFMKERA